LSKDICIPSLTGGPIHALERCYRERTATEVLEDYQLNYYPVTELAERFSISRKTAYKWIDRFEEHGQNGFHEQPRRPHGCPWQTDPAIVQEVVELRKAHLHWGPRKLLDLIHRRHRQWVLPAVLTAARILARQRWARSERRYRRAHPGCPKIVSRS
jgi:transposase